MAVTTSKDDRLYLTVRKPHNGGSKTITVHGISDSPEKLLNRIVRLLRTPRTKAG